jgi:hypothetical protein
MKQKRILISMSIILPIILVGWYLLFHGYIDKSKITSYQGTDGAFYACSRPLPAKKASIPHIGSTSEGLVPINQDDAEKYCQTTGIE